MIRKYDFCGLEGRVQLTYVRLLAFRFVILVKVSRGMLYYDM